MLRQVQSEAAFPNTVPVDIITSKGKVRFAFKPNSKETIDQVNLDEAPSAVNIDPDNTILKEARVVQHP